MKRLVRTPTLIWETVMNDLRIMGDHLIDDGWTGFFPWLHSRDAPPTVQFLKYSICGAMATIVQLGIAIVLGATLFPAFEGLVGHEIPDALRERNLKIANLLAFPFANVTAYYLNILWVFTTGRHSKWREFWLFTAISAFSFGVGVFGGPELIGWFGIPSWMAQVGFMVTSAMVNFVCRKFLVFAG